MYSALCFVKINYAAHKSCFWPRNTTATKQHNTNTKYRPTDAN